MNRSSLSQKACKPDRGIETLPLAVLPPLVAFCQKACKPDRGIETIQHVPEQSHCYWSQKACKPDRGIETSWSQTGWKLERTVRRPVSPIAGLKRANCRQFSEYASRSEGL